MRKHCSSWRCLRFGIRNDNVLAGAALLEPNFSDYFEVKVEEIRQLLDLSDDRGEAY
jgi:hypothetical protein